jgi:predicted regulator of Ras-like GTPase activity (Roadblock/LC7/MglB family)
MAQPAHNPEQGGFVGAISGMSLADIIQVKGNNRYSGCIVIEHLGKSGMIFLRDGDVVHAEQGALVGEEAFYSIMGWTGGSFRDEPKVSTTGKTINQPLGFLILEAFRRIDEIKNNPQPPQQAAANSGKEGDAVSDINEKLKAIPEVEQAVIMTKEGIVVDDTSYEAEFMGANGLFLALFAGQLGSHFGVGEPKSITVHGTEQHMFLFDSKRHYLCVSAKAGGNVNALDGEIRRILAQK